ncbi:MAG: type III-B CRISPR-associated protein Cas10/Cmr2, partial [candidate division WOR-3 bacterium]
MNDQAFWQAKVLAFLHDPAEKALVLLRGKGHEAGTVAAMKELLGADLASVYESGREAQSIVKTADRWAAAADRPSLPMNLGPGVIFAADPQIIHPLSGRLFRLMELVTEARAEVIEALSFEHFQELVVWDDTEKTRPDWRRTFLSLWRFAPETPAKGLGTLWNLLPADTRSPDHTIWEHLKLTSAFAGALAANPTGPALLLMSFGPVQGFISQARSVSDLWAGSHLLSRIAWEGMRILCDMFGPDSVLFPDLHGVPIADLWLRQELQGDWKGKRPEWMIVPDDTNPLFAAALPNRFVALVPSAQAQNVAERIKNEVRDWVRKCAEDALKEVLDAAGRKEAPHARSQLDRQFKHFPEVNWAIVPWSLAGTKRLEDGPLKELLRWLGASSDYLPEDLDSLVRGEILVAGHPFFSANPGVGY